MLKYSMGEASTVAARATRDVTEYLLSLGETVSVRNVEHDPAYQQRDIDLVWVTKDPAQNIAVEIKGDRYHRTGNYFLETVSNKGKGTPGCFLYTEADLLFYYFVDERELHVLLVAKARAWFLDNIDQFPERETSTPIRNGEGYITVGRLVPRAVMQENVPEIGVFKI